jgi:betaine-aldehyde dehydrogenase
MCRIIQPFINGRLVPSSSLPAISLLESATNQPSHCFHPSSPAQINEAISCAKIAQESWANDFSPAQRGAILRKTADILGARSEAVAAQETLDTGRPIQETRVDITSVTDCLYYYAGIAPVVGGTTHDLGGSFCYTRREALGVTAGIGAWNYPLQSAGWLVLMGSCIGNRRRRLRLGIA